MPTATAHREAVASPTVLSPMMPVATRLRPAPSGGTPWYVPPSPRDPFAHDTRASRAVRDSMLAALSREFAELVARRVPTQAERDARAKEAMLKMRLAGRILLVPPDNSGGIITASIPLPWLAGTPGRKGKRERAAEAQRLDRQIQERLRQRADSSRHGRPDSATRPLVAP